MFRFQCVYLFRSTLWLLVLLREQNTNNFHEFSCKFLRSNLTCYSQVNLFDLSNSQTVFLLTKFYLKGLVEFKNMFFCLSFEFLLPLPDHCDLKRKLLRHQFLEELESEPVLFENLSSLFIATCCCSVVFGANGTSRTALPFGASVTYVSINILERNKTFVNIAHRLYPVDKSRMDTDTITEEAIDFGNNTNKKTN